MRIALLALVPLLGSCGHLPTLPSPSFEKTAEIAAAVNLYGPPVPAKRVHDQPEEFAGRTLLLDGFVVEACDDDAREYCAEYNQYFEVYSGDELPLAPGPAHQPCPLSGPHGISEVLVSGSPPAGFRQVGDRRALIRGTLSRRPASVTFSFPGSGTTLESQYDFVLDDVTILALYDTVCDRP